MGPFGTICAIGGRMILVPHSENRPICCVVWDTGVSYGRRLSLGSETLLVKVYDRGGEWRRRSMFSIDPMRASYGLITIRGTVNCEFTGSCSWM